MDNKSFSIISYITLIGWLVAYFGGKDTADDLLKYHLKQSLGLAVCSILFQIAINILTLIMPILGILSFLGIIFFILLVIGIINAANSEKKPLPLIGKAFETRFSFID
ncbi:DUF4870 domain-containing protein [Flavobacterium sp. NKUCC04_CG]|uniref:DUF4870 domain-containing protein n=1 Tax=Flavobacterium sp. NKUCC04_CG TaxID=2842121 RepID=UPI001C5AD9B4|nr:DUF4870 domain-containing protein [Flavobacterium sp. NKUCC04_CG]MBW3518659.1 DUF4870 domain-containing protein [Flavobacterium sp. NKUCC04_CG]